LSGSPARAGKPFHGSNRARAGVGQDHPDHTVGFERGPKGVFAVGAMHLDALDEVVDLR
jgi:hypothetical protein